MTLEFWFKATLMDADLHVIIHQHIDVPPATTVTLGNSFWYAAIDNRNNDPHLVVTFNARNEFGAWDDGRTGFQPTVGTWYHVAGVWNGIQGHVYLDGTLIHSYVSNEMTGNDVPGSMAFGNQTVGDRPYKGLLSDVRLWDQARTAQQINDLRLTRLTGEENGLIGYWPLNEGSGTTINDWTVSGNNGTLTSEGGAWQTDSGLTLLAADAPFDPAAGFTLADFVTGSTDFTSSNEVEVVAFPIPDDVHDYQITDSGNIEAIDPNAWESIAGAPVAGDTWTFDNALTETSLIWHAWFTNTTSGALMRGVGGITRTAVEPVMRVNGSAVLSRSFTGTAVFTVAEVDAGTTGGTFGGDPIPLHALVLSCPQDLTPEAAYVTLDTAGTYTLTLTAMNAAGTVASASSEATIRHQMPPLLRYSVANATIYRALPPSFRHSSISSNTLVAASGITANSSNTQWQWKSFTSWRTYDQAVDINEYWHFSFEVTNALTVVTLSQLDIRVGKGNNGPRRFTIKASVNGGTEIPLFFYDFYVESGNLDSPVAAIHFQIGLEDIPELKTGDEVLFRLVPHTCYGSSGGVIFYMQNIATQTYGLEVSGEVVKIPAGTVISIR